MLPLVVLMPTKIKFLLYGHKAKLDFDAIKKAVWIQTAFLFLL